MEFLPCFLRAYSAISIRLRLTGQCNQMATLFFNIWPCTTLKGSPKHYNFAKVGSNTD